MFSPQFLRAMSPYPRHEFPETSSAGLAGAGLSGSVSPAVSTDRLRFGVPGGNGMDWTDLQWDPEARRFVDDAEANSLVTPTCREPWSPSRA